MNQNTNNSSKSIDTTALQEVYKIRPDSVYLGGIVGTGLNQGVIIDSQSNIIRNLEVKDYEFTGYYGAFKLDNPKVVITEGFSDSIQYSYYPNNSLKSKGFHRHHKKNGVFLEFYENGNLKFEGFYKNDTLIDNSISYYPNKRIKSIGNNFNGQFCEYDENGRLISKIEYKNKKNVELQIFPQSEEVETKKFPIIKDFDNNNILNETDLKIESVFSQTRESKNRIEWSLFNLWNDRSVCFDNQLYMYFGDGHTLILNDQDIEYCNNCIGYNSKRRLKIENFNIQNEEVEKTYSLSLGKLTIRKKRRLCNDTNLYNIKIEKKGKILHFKELFNVIFFESKHDGVDRLYIVSYQTCGGNLDIYRIRN